MNSMGVPVSEEQPIVAETLVMRPVEPRDAPTLVRINSDQAVQDGLGKATPPTFDGTLGEIAGVRERWGGFFDPRFMFVVTLESQVIGWVELHPGLQGTPPNLIGELTVVIDHDHRGSGHAKMALGALIEWGFKRFPSMREMWGSCVLDNGASMAMMEALGMEDCGTVSSNEGRTVRKFRLERA